MDQAGPHTTRAHAAYQAQRVAVQVREAPLWLRALILLIILFAFIVGVLIIVPLAVLALIATLIIRAIRGVRQTVSAPNGPLDKRRNVRVIVPEQRD